MKRLFNKVIERKYFKKSTKGTKTINPMDLSQSNVGSLIDDGDLDEACRGRLTNLEYEEVALVRNCDTQRLGLTLCYDHDGDVETNIFVSQIEADSLIDKDGRIKVGDQVLQINGIDIHTKKQAVDMFSQPTLEVTLLVARSALDNLSLTTLSTSSLHQQNDNLNDICFIPNEESSLPKVIREEDEAGSSDGTRVSVEKDSGISRTTDSDPDSPPKISPIQPIRPLTKVLTDHPSTSATSSNGRLFTLIKSPRFASESSLLNKDYMKRRVPEIDLDRELRHLHKEMENIQLECDRLIAEHVEVEQQVEKQLIQSKNKTIFHTPSFFPKFIGGKQNFVDAKAPIATHDETSSAYNTGNDSCRSTPLKNVVEPVLSKNSLPSTLTKRNNNLLNFKEYSNDSQSSPNMSKLNSANFKFNQLENNVSLYNSNRSVLEFDCVSSSSELMNPNSNVVLPDQFNVNDPMFTDPLYLQRMILFQQRLLRQAMVQQAYKLKAEQERLANQQVQLSPNKNEHLQPHLEGLRLEWKLKRRSDGSRYITRRLVRNKILKERAQQLSAIRTGLSTDDDAMSELKTGRYWTREERKKHLERAKERKKRIEEVKKRKLEVVREVDDQTILRLSQKKLLRRQGQELLDNFTTIQEFLSHDTRTVESKKSLGGILSVTTV